MSEADATISPEEQMLGELAELDLALAKHVHARALAAESADDINSVGRTYQRVSRSLRQTLALKTKLARERAAAAVRRAPPPEPHVPRVNWGMEVLDPQLRDRVEDAHRAVWRWLERERPDCNDPDETEVYEALLQLADEEDLIGTPMATVVDRALKILGCMSPEGAPIPSDAAAAYPAEPEPPEPEPPEPEPPAPEPPAPEPAEPEPAHPEPAGPAVHDTA